MADHEITRVRPGARNAQTLCGYCGDPVAIVDGAWAHDGSSVKPKYPEHRYKTFTKLTHLSDEAIAETIGICVRTVKRYRTRYRKEEAKNEKLGQAAPDRQARGTAGVMTYMLPNDKPYLDQTCPQCGRTNRECYEDVADAQGITLEEAMRQFPPKSALSEPGASVTQWSPGWVK